MIPLEGLLRDVMVHVLFAVLMVCPVACPLEQAEDVQTLGSTQCQRIWASPACLAVAGTAAGLASEPLSFRIHLPLPLRSAGVVLLHRYYEHSES